MVTLLSAPALAERCPPGTEPNLMPAYAVFGVGALLAIVLFARRRVGWGIAVGVLTVVAGVCVLFVQGFSGSCV